DGNTVVVVTTDHGNSGITIGSDYYNQNIGSYDKETFDNTVNKLLGAKITEERFNTLAKEKSDNEILTLAKENYGFDLTKEELIILKDKGIREIIALRVGIGYTTGGHTGEEVYLGVYAPQGIKLLDGVVDNTEVNKYMQQVLFGTEILATLTGDIFKNGESTLSSIEGTKASINENVKHSPKVIIERLGNVIELELYTNNYTINGENKELKTVMPYIDGKYYISQELVNIVSNLKVVPKNETKPNEALTEKNEVVIEKIEDKALENKLKIEENMQTVVKPEANIGGNN
ncbi:MAG: alkaline phosphatase, partial [Clostridium sp.]